MWYLIYPGSCAEIKILIPHAFSSSAPLSSGDLLEPAFDKTSVESVFAGFQDNGLSIESRERFDIAINRSGSEIKEVELYDD